MRIAKMAVITSVSLKSKLKKNAVIPRPNNAICGNAFVGCNLPNALKNSPSRAAA